MADPDPFDRLRPLAAEMDLVLDAEAVGLLRRHFELVLARNEVMNLTRVTDPSEAVTKLYLSSLAAVPALRQLGVLVEGFFRALDLGTGAGFPGIPLAVAFPALEMTLLDARRKKIDFLEGAVRELGLGNVRAVHGRAGELPRTRPDLAGVFDLVTSRAVASAAETVREAADLLMPGGVLVVYKGPGLEPAEIGEGTRAAERQGMVFRGVVEPAIEGLAPRLLVYSRWSSRDEGLFDG